MMGGMMGPGGMGMGAASDMMGGATGMGMGSAGMGMGMGGELTDVFLCGLQHSCSTCMDTAELRLPTG